MKAGVREETLHEDVCKGAQTILQHTDLKAQVRKQAKANLVMQRNWRQFGEIVDNQIFREISVLLWVHNKDEGRSQPLWKPKTH